jgi:hypothetical protein
MPWWSGRRGTALIVVAVTGAGLVLAGCTGGTPADAETTTPPPVETTPTPTPIPTPTPTVDVTVKPTRPAALDQPPSVEGAVAVAEYFVRLFPYVNATGDLAEWSRLSHPDCLFCADVTSTVKEKVTFGQHDEGGNLDVVQRSATEVDPSAWYTVTLEFVQHPSVTVNATGTVVEEFPETKSLTSNLVVIWQDGQWLIRGVDSAPTEGS